MNRSADGEVVDSHDLSHTDMLGDIIYLIVKPVRMSCELSALSRNPVREKFKTTNETTGMVSAQLLHSTFANRHSTIESRPTIQQSTPLNRLRSYLEIIH